MTREEWLRKLVEKLNSSLFNGELDILNTEYQISAGRVRCYRPNIKYMFEVFLPYQGEDVTMDDFFPPTIIISHLLKDPVDMLAATALGCIQAFFGHQRLDKKYKEDAERFYFEFDGATPVISDFLRTQLLSIYGSMVKTYGDYPGKPVYTHKKDKRETKKNTFKLFCPNPECGYELKISRATLNRFSQKTPTCICGSKMAVDLSEESPAEKLD